MLNCVILVAFGCKVYRLFDLLSKLDANEPNRQLKVLATILDVFDRDY